MSPKDYARQLADEKKRLELLAGEDESVTASISLSYNLLDAETQKHWRMLAVFPDTFDAPAAANVWEIKTDAVRDTLSRLLQFSMLEWNDSTKRYRLHDLMRAFARQRLTAHETDAAARRHATHYGAALATADEFYKRGGDSLMIGLALFDLERGNIHAGQAWAATHASKDGEAAELCRNYPGWGAFTLALRQRPREQIRWLEAALAAARQLRDLAAEGIHLGNLGLAHARLGDYRRAVEFYENHLAIARELGDRRGEGNALGNLGVAHANLGDHRRAIEHFQQLLEIACELGDRREEGNAHGCLG